MTLLPDRRLRKAGLPLEAFGSARPISADRLRYARGRSSVLCTGQRTLAQRRADRLIDNSSTRSFIAPNWELNQFF
jgi:hypothetical protein